MAEKKLWRGSGAVPLWGGVLGPHLTLLAKAEAYLHAKFHLDPYSRLAATYMDRGLYGRRLFGRRQSLRP